MTQTEPHGAAPDALRRAGERIEELLDASSAAGIVARERSEELVRQVTALYGAGLARVLEILGDTGVLTPALQDALVADDLVASLLLVHGLHPHGVRTRVEAALESVRPYLGTHGGDVELMDVSDDGVVRLRLLGSCDGCPSSAATLELAVHSAIEAAAPEVTSIEVLADEPPAAAAPAVIPVVGAPGQARRPGEPRRRPLGGGARDRGAAARRGRRFRRRRHRAARLPDRGRRLRLRRPLRRVRLDHGRCAARAVRRPPGGRGRADLPALPQPLRRTPRRCRRRG